MSSGMNIQEAEKVAEKMTYRQAVINCLNAKCVPYRKATKIKMKQLLESIDNDFTDDLLNQGYTKGYTKGYEQGRVDRDKELAEHNVFCSNRPIEDLVLDAIAEERERIIRELEELEKEVEYMNQFDSGFNSAIYKAIEIVRGGENE